MDISWKVQPAHRESTGLGRAWPVILEVLLLVPLMAQHYNRLLRCSVSRLSQCALTHQARGGVPRSVLKSLATERNHPLLFNNVNRNRVIVNSKICQDAKNELLSPYRKPT